MKFQLLCFNFLHLVFNNVFVHSRNEENSLRVDLFKNNFLIARPVGRKSEAITVDVAISIYYIMEINELSQTVSLQATLRVSWLATYPFWDPNYYNGTTEFELPWEEKIWDPQITFNDLPIKPHDWIIGEKTFLYSDGGVFQFVDVKLTLPCKFDFYFFPNDVQSCQFLAYAKGYALSEVDINWFDPSVKRSSSVRLNAVVENYLTNGWQFANVEYDKFYSVANYPSLTKRRPEENLNWAHPLLATTLKFSRRKPHFYLTQSLPFVITCLLTFGMFWVDGQDALLTLVIVDIIVQALSSWDLLQELPLSSENVPKIVIIYACHFGLTCFAFVFILILDKLSSLSVEIPISVEIVVSKFSRFEWMQTKFISLNNKIGKNVDNDDEGAEEIDYLKAIYGKLLKLLRTLTFFVYIVIYICLFCLFII